MAGSPSGEAGSRIILGRGAEPRRHVAGGQGATLHCRRRPAACTATGEPEDQIAEQSTFTLQVRVVPNARTPSLTELEDGTWQARVRARPVDGKANAELEAMIARRFGVAKSRVAVVRGGSSRTKVVKVVSTA